MKPDKRKQTAAQRVFSNYTVYISNMVIEQYGPSYSSQLEMRNTWRCKIPYTDEIEDFLIFKTKMFIRFLDSRNSNSTNPQFLDALTRRMADYLSAYTVRSLKRETRKKAREQLRITLYDESTYIQNLLLRQAINRDARDASRRNIYKRPSGNKNARQAQDIKQKYADIQSQQTNKIVEIVVRKR